MEAKRKFTIELTWDDETNTYFNVEVEGEQHEYMAILMWITRGTLRASSAHRAVCYNDEGFDVVSYIQ